MVRVDPEARLNQHLDYFGTTVIEFGISRPHEHLSIDVRRVSGQPRPWSRRRPLQRDRGPRLRRGRGRVPAARRFRARRCGDRPPRRPHPHRIAARHRAALGRGDPGSLRVPRGRDLRRLDRRRPAGRGRRCLSGLRAPGAAAPAPARHRRALRVRLPVGAVRERTRQGPRRSRPTPGSRRYYPGGGAWPGSASIPTNRTLGGESPREVGHGRHYADVPPIKGVYRGTAGLGAERVGADDPRRRVTLSRLTWVTI